MTLIAALAFILCYVARVVKYARMQQPDLTMAQPSSSVVAFCARVVFVYLLIDHSDSVLIDLTEPFKVKRQSLFTNKLDVQLGIPDLKLRLGMTSPMNKASTIDYKYTSS